jgi:hypothetical protein
MSSRADKLSFDTATNFTRANRYLVPGTTPEIVSVPNNPQLSQPTTSISNVDDILLAENTENLHDGPTQQVNNNEETAIVSDYDDIDNEVEEDEEQLRASEELYQDFTMAEILGQSEVYNFNFLSGAKNEIERHVREITFPRVEILV